MNYATFKSLNKTYFFLSLCERSARDFKSDLVGFSVAALEIRFIRDKLFVLGFYRS